MEMKQIKLDVDNICFCLCTFYNNGKANVMLIDSVWTDEKYRHQGYGNKLMKKVIELARKEGWTVNDFLHEHLLARAQGEAVQKEIEKEKQIS